MNDLYAQTKIKKITSQIVEKYKPEKIILFGSALKGNIGPNSDLDLAIIKNTKKRFYDRIGEVLKIVRSITPKPPLDLLIYTPSEFKKMVITNYFVKDEIFNKGKVLYEK